MNALLQQFLSEAKEALEGIGNRLMQLESAPADGDLMTELFRLVHTLKGNSGLFDFPEMTRVLHAGEDLMDAVRSGRVAYSQTLADRLLDAMDFVESLCADIEAEKPGAGADQGDAAVLLAQKLRELMVAPSQGKSEEAPGARTGSADASPAHETVSAALLAAFQRMPEEQHADLMMRLQAGEVVHWVAYRPDEQCFYQGDDPLLRTLQTPGLVWSQLRQREAWPALPDLDAFRCVLDFEMFCAAPREALEAHFRYVPEQRQIETLSLAHLQTAMAAGAEATPAPNPHTSALDDLVQAQREQLSLPNDGKGLAGRLQAIHRTLKACLEATGRHAELAGLQLALDAALAEQQSAALSHWLAQAFPAPLAVQSPLSPAPDSGSTPEDGRQEPELKFGRRAEDGSGAKSLRVDQQKVDHLMNLIGEMVVAKNAIPYLATRAEEVFGSRELSREIKAQYAVINRISEEMQDAIMQVRMLPVSFVFQRFPRLVRDISRRLGKEIELHMAGQDTAADKNVIEALGDPLMHIVRNSLDHGIELPEVRVAAGKPAAGSLRINAHQEGDRVLIEIVDDGKGIDPDVVKRKALTKGLIDEATAQAMSDQEAVNLVFAPGFSTAEVVSDLSGRGVGMDVVRTAVERVNGSIALTSVAGRGTRIALSLPLSMAISQVITIETDGQTFGLPMDAVVETVRIARSAVRPIKQNLTTILRGRVVPLKSLNRILGLAAPPLTNSNDELAILVVKEAGETWGLIVDDFRATTDIILKPMAGVLGGLNAYAGSALMGDGSVLMVLNVKELR